MAKPANAGQLTFGSWELMDLATFSSIIEPRWPVEASEAASIRTDRNRDGINCVLTQVLPNDASGSDTSLINVDNPPVGR